MQSRLTQLLLMAIALTWRFADVPIVFLEPIASIEKKDLLKLNHVRFDIFEEKDFGKCFLRKTEH
jgi:hypothetical protein